MFIANCTTKCENVCCGSERTENVPVPMIRPVGMIAVETIVDENDLVVGNVVIISGMRMIMMTGTSRTTGPGMMVGSAAGFVGSGFVIRTAAGSVWSGVVIRSTTGAVMSGFVIGSTTGFVGSGSVVSRPVVSRPVFRADTSQAVDRVRSNFLIVEAIT